MLEAKDKKIGEHTYTVTPAPARRALKALPLIGKPESVSDVCRLLLEDLSFVDGKPLWPQFDTHFQGNMARALELLEFAIELQGFSPAADGDKQKASLSGE